jgi:hypothetical protein
MTPSNGYVWYLKNANNENVQELGALQQVGDWTFVSDNPQHPIGASGYQVIRYIPKASGSANLHFELIQSWTQEKALDAYDIEAVSAGAYKGDYKAPEQNKLDDKIEAYTSANKSSALPAAFSRLANQEMTVCKNQGSCGSCWSFAACGIFESMIKAHDKVTRDLSEQWLINCTSGSNCSGGWFPEGMFEKGAVYEADAPYKGKDGTCGTYTRHEKSISSKEIAENPTIEQIKTAIYTYGPVWVGVNAGSNFSAYKSGVLSKTDAGECNHAVVLCGWDDATSSWVLRNSWGTSFGENQGYMRIKYGTSKIGTKATYMVYGTTTGIDADQVADQQATVYPNPIADGKLTVNLSQFDNNQVITITINDIQGKVVFKQEEKQNAKVEIDATAFSQGMYFVNVSSQSKTANYKIVKQ